jgi:CTP:molybdopterin cytidylyltransferase MocA
MKAAGLITVAGQSLRMLAFKPLLPINGKPMIAHTADVFLQAGITDLFFVVGNRGEEIVSALPGKNMRFVWNRAYTETEMFDSVRIGLEAVRSEGGFDAAFLLPGDMPAVPPLILKDLMAEMESGGWDAVFPSTGTRRLHPPLIRASCFDALIAYHDGDGLRGAFRGMESRIGYVVTSQAGCGIDVDTPDDYAKAQRYLTPETGKESAR